MKKLALGAAAGLAMALAPIGVANAAAATAALEPGWRDSSVSAGQLA